MALNHAAFVIVENGRAVDYRLVVDQPTVVKVDPSKATLIRHKNRYDRLNFWGNYIYDVITELEPDLVAIEDYAYAAGQGAHQLGELGGLLRLTLWNYLLPFKVYAPGTIKKHATGKGNASKAQMLEASGGQFKQWSPGKKLTYQEDLVDAYFAALVGEADDDEGWIINV